MTVLLDSSTLVAGLWSGHPRHLVAARWLARSKRGEVQASVSAHGLAEAYAVLTGLPVVPRLHPTLVNQALEDVLTYVRPAALALDAHLSALAQAPNAGAIGGAVYDFLHIATARQESCEAIVTLNPKDFQRLSRGIPPRIIDGTE